MLSPDQQKPVTILGAGIVGICTALSLIERGVPVTVIDQGEPGQETSMGNAGVVSPWSIIPQALPGTWKTIPKLMFGYGRPLSIDPRVFWNILPWGLRFLRQGQLDRLRRSAMAMSHLCGPSIELYQRHLKGTGQEALLVDSMYIHAFRDGSRANLDAIDYRIRAQMGAELELVGRDGLRSCEPALSPEFKAAILIKGQARVLSPGKLGTVLADKARTMGATFKRTSVREIRRTESGWQIKCDGETLAAERVVVCLGVWSRAILKGLGLSVPLMAERGYHVEFQEPGIEVNNSVMDVDAKVVASSMEGGLRVAGQAEFAPIDAPPTKRREKQLIGIATALFPGMEQRHNRFWMGHRPSFPDSLPALGPVPDQPGLFVNFGHSHYGLMMAPSSGEKLASALCNERLNINLETFSLDRF
ncbi:MAG: FAD-binding oxidoreductase [Roseobacter sp. MedPE-SW]|nr:MAG: FAD-binding oxidoreductase [Roseobacter sp. MedPE-SW]